MLKDLWLVLRGRLSSEQLEAQRQNSSNLSWRLNDAQKNTHALHQAMVAMASRLVAANPDLRYFAQPELDPKRKADSDALGQAVIDKMLAEHKARMHSEGKL